MSCQTLLIDCITEELPPGQIVMLSKSLENAVTALLSSLSIEFKGSKAFAAPRHLGLQIFECHHSQPSHSQWAKGPSIKAAKDAEGNWSRAALGFAKKHGIEPDALQDQDGKLSVHITTPAKSLEDVLCENLQTIIDNLPVAKKMRWGDKSFSFARPVHGLTVMHGSQPLEKISIFGLSACNMTQGHRFLSSGQVKLSSADDFEKTLEEHRVIVDFNTRRAEIEKQLKNSAKSLNLTLDLDTELLDEVTNLVEWPVVVTAQFDDHFLKLPSDVPITAMKSHQRYFPLFKENSELSNHFCVVANMVTKDPKAIIDGNERVVRARLQDAHFFFELDARQPLESRVPALDRVVFQHKLGSIGDKIKRMQGLVAHIAPHVGACIEASQTACGLAKADLTTQMVMEFPELQGSMGAEYARREGLPESTVLAISEHYRPAYSGQTLPETPMGLAISLADKIDTLVGIFGIGLKPTGNKDPFALRRQVIGVLRILIEKELSINFDNIIQEAIDLYPIKLRTETHKEIIEFTQQRLIALYKDQGINPKTVQSILITNVTEPVDIAKRIEAVEAFMRMPQAPALSQANKRVINILSKAKIELKGAEVVEEKYLEEGPEQALHAALNKLAQKTAPLVASRQYADVLTSLASLEPLVNEFFDGVMVMVEDEHIRNNRLKLLSVLRGLFLQVGDISELAI